MRSTNKVKEEGTFLDMQGVEEITLEEILYFTENTWDWESEEMDALLKVIEFAQKRKKDILAEIN